MGRKLISLSFKASTDLPELEDLKTYLVTDFARQVPGFTLLETNAEWGDCVLDLVGKDDTGSIIAVFPSVSRVDRDFHAVIAHAMVAGTWLEENRAELTRRYRGVDPGQPFRMILVAPGNAAQSRAVARTLEKAGVETMSYAIYDIDTGDGLVRAVSFDPHSAPPLARPSVATGVGRLESPSTQPSAAPPSETVTARVEERAAMAAMPGVRDEFGGGAEVVASVPQPEAALESAALAPVGAFISSLSDANLKTMSQQVVTFLRQRFPSVEGAVNGRNGFTLTVARQHLATVRLDRSAIWLEVGPERIPTNKIRDPQTLDRAMNLPSVLEALNGVNGA